MNDDNDWIDENSKAAILLECFIEVFSCLVIGAVIALVADNWNLIAGWFA
jgi:hypothetical protein